MTEQEIFFEVIEIENADERDAYLRGACGKDVTLRRKVDELLVEHFANDTLLSGPAVEGRPTEIELTPISEGTGSLIDRYKLLQKIGEGGFGVVYMAEQKEPVKRRVALKIIKLGMDTKQVVARFEAERQALAMMNHPNIAKVLDAGATETGRPYFVMELVKGIHITKYCDENNLDMDERLDLFMNVCAAIQHAHQKGIIHRDIKPSNILITLHDGVPVPKVIDFGIAKATQQELTEKTLFTQFSQFIGTPAYMSPEQAEISGLDIDTRSDIYSLGVLLYELLTGSTPLDSKELMSRGYDEIRRRIKEEEPSKPSTRVSTMEGEEQTDVARHRKTDQRRLSHQLRGDLDWIAMKALEKDRTRRYETANAFRLDVQRFLGNEPVTAVAPRVGYKFQKFVRRNRVVFAASSAVAAALVIGITVAIWQAVRANRHARVAEQKTSEALIARQLAQQQREVAEANVEMAKKARAGERKQRYATDMAVVQNAAQERDAKLGMAILNTHVPGPDEADLRGWEWRYLFGQFAQETVRKRVFENAHEISVSPDGKLVALGGGTKWEQAVQILSYPELKRMQILPKPRGQNGGMRFSADSDLLYLEKSGVREFDLRTGAEKVLLDPSLSKGAWPLKLSQDGRWLVGAYGTTNGLRELRSFDAETGELIAVSEPFKILDSGMRDHILQISPNSSAVAEGCADGMLRIFSVPELENANAIQSPGNISVVAWSPDGEHVATGYDYPYHFDLWDAGNADHVGTLPDEFLGPGLDLCFSPDGSRLAGCDWGNIISVWRTDTLERIARFSGHREGRTWSIAFHPDNRTLVSAGGQGTVHLWDTSIESDSELRDLSRKQQLRHFKFSPDGQTLATSGSDGIVSLFDANTEKFLGQLDPPEREQGDPPLYSWAPQLAFSSDGRNLVAGNGDRTATVYDMRSRKAEFVLDGHSNALVNIRYSPDDRLIGITGEDNKLTLWDSATGERTKEISGPRYFDFHPEPGSQIVAAREEHSVTLLNIDTEERRTIPEEEGHNFWSVTFSPDGKFLAIGMEAQFGLYRVSNLKLVTLTTGPRGPVPMVTFHPGGKTIGVPAWGGTFQLWNANVGDLVTRLPIPKDLAVSSQFSPDGDTLAVSTMTSGIQFFRAPSTGDMEGRRRAEERSAERFAEIDREIESARRRSWQRRFAGDPGSINQWLLLGPIPFESRDGKNGQGFHEHFRDEASLKPLAGEKVFTQDREFAWREVRQRDPVFNFRRIYSSEAPDAPLNLNNQSVFAVSYLWCDQPLDDVIVKTGTDDLSILYLNGQEISRSLTRSNPPLDQDEVTGIQLKQGVNRLVFRVDNNAGGWGGSVRFTDAEGNPLKGVRSSLNPDDNP